MNVPGPRGRAAHLITSFWTAALLSVGGTNAALAAGAQPVVLTANVTVLVGPEEAGPVRRAAADLQDDLEKVFGTRPRLVASAAEAGPVTILIGQETNLPPGLRPAGATAPESFAIAVQPLGSGHAVVLTGPDVRGTIYAIYQFSQDYLGVDPMYYWTDLEPPKRTLVELPATLARVFPPPVFKYRGFFINDEDLLTGWAPGEQTDHCAIALPVMDKIYETILRLKGNLVVPGTWIFPDDPQVKLVGERGLILTQHHAIPLGVNVARWPEGVPYNFSTHPEILERAWKNAVAAYDPHQEILWSVGLRGLSDTSYATMDPSVVGNDQRLGLLISKAIATQIGIVRAVRPDAQFVTDFWREGAGLVHAGLLTIPPGVIPVWADTGYGDPQDGGMVAPGEGVYYHVAMYNGRANQLSELVPVSRIEAELGRYIQAKATAYVLLNTSDLRPVAMTAKAVMTVAWGGVPAGGADDYYRAWAAEEFGAESAETVARIYREYFDAPAVTPAGRWGAGQRYGDQLYYGEARAMLLSAMVSAPYYYIPSQDPKWTPPRISGLGPQAHSFFQFNRDTMLEVARHEMAQCAGARPRWDAVWQAAVAAEPLVAPARRPYYEAQLLAMIAFNRDGNRILELTSQAVTAFHAGDPARARAAIEATLPLFDEMRRLQGQAEYGKWKHWYRGEWLDGIRSTRALAEDFIRYLDDPMTSLPPPVMADSWQGYYHIMHYEGDRTVDVH